jgi:branched-chain amino acid transport system ATP-binding protein
MILGEQLAMASVSGTGAPILQLSHVSKHFGGVCAVGDVSFDVREGEILGVIGPNGSGKTTLFNCISGMMAPEAPSDIRLRGVGVVGRRPDEISRLGLVRTFQEARVFRRMTTIESLLLALQQHQEDSFYRRFFHARSIAQFEARGRKRAHDLLEMVDLAAYEKAEVGTLSYGQRKLLIFIAALMPEPALVLLDEPVAAVNPVLIDKLRDHIRRANQLGTTFLVVEHNMEFLLNICSRIIALDRGIQIAAGAPSDILANQAVIDAYFGV